MAFHDTWQDIISMSMSSLLIGTGWHEVEKLGEQYFRWTGPDSQSTIHLCEADFNEYNPLANEILKNGLLIA